MEETINDRLRLFIKSQGMKVGQFEKSINVSLGFVNNISKGIGKEKLNTIRELYPMLNIEWLIFGEGPMLNQSASISVGGSVQSNGDGGVNIQGDNNTLTPAPPAHEVQALNEKLKMMEQLLQEKERTIQSQQTIIDILSATKE